MITITARCPHCEETFAAGLFVGQPLTCARCQKTIAASVPDLEGADAMRCLACPSTELFLRKDFPQRLGVTIVLVGFLGSSIAWAMHKIFWAYGVLFATALVDVLLYVLMGNVTECYRCHAQYRGLSPREDQEGFQLEIHEKYRQQAARLRENGARGAGVESDAAPPSVNPPRE
jgi:hypothetical protein